MKQLIISYLLAVLSGSCYGQSNNNCSKPSFINTQYSTSFHCHLYKKPQAVNMGKEVIIRPNVTGSNLTLIWTITINGTTKVIDKNRKEFFLKDKNMTLKWLSARKGSSLIKVTATSTCGQTIGCFNLQACVAIDSCRLVPSVPSEPPNETNKTVDEGISLSFAPTTIHADPAFSKVSWCFVGATDHNVCCTCDGQCSQSDWIIRKYTDTCGCEYSCALTINSTSMKYNNGTFLTKVSFGQNATLAVNHITVIPKHNHRSHLIHSIYYVIGSGAGVIVVIFLTIGVLCNFKEHGCCSRKKHFGIMHPVDHPTSPTEVEGEGESMSEPLLEPTTSDFNPPPSATYGSTEQHRVV